MSKVLIVAEHDGSKLNPSTAKCVTCARGIAGADITVVVCAADAAAVAAQAAQLTGVTRVLTVENPANAHLLSATVAPQIVALDFKPDPDKLARWAELGVTEVLFGLPDKTEAEVAAYVERLAGKLAALV